MVYHRASPMALTPTLDLEDQCTTTSESLRFLLNCSAPSNGYSPKVAIMVVSPSFDDSPIIATLAGSEEVLQMPDAEVIGKSMQSLDGGCKNDAKALAFMRKISSSAEAAEEFRRRSPKGRSFVLRHGRPAQTTPTSNNGKKKSRISHQCTHIFGFEVSLQNTVYPLLVRVQYELTHPGEVTQAGPEARAIQGLLEDSPDLRVALREWISMELARFISNCSRESPRSASTENSPFHLDPRPEQPLTRAVVARSASKEKSPLYLDMRPEQPLTSMDLASSASTEKGPFYLDMRPEQPLTSMDLASSASTEKGPFYLDMRPEQPLTSTDLASSASTVKGPFYLDTRPEQPLKATDLASSASTVKGPVCLDSRPEQPLTSTDLASSASTVKEDEPAVATAEKRVSTADLVGRLRVLEATIEQLTIAGPVEGKHGALAQMRSAHSAARRALMTRFDELVELRRKANHNRDILRHVERES